ncbi:hypothetical protein D3C85_1735950 [compost metagenome]
MKSGVANRCKCLMRPSGISRRCLTSIRVAWRAAFSKPASTRDRSSGWVRSRYKDAEEGMPAGYSSMRATCSDQPMRARSARKPKQPVWVRRWAPVM